MEKLFVMSCNFSGEFRCAQGLSVIGWQASDRIVLNISPDAHMLNNFPGYLLLHTLSIKELIRS